MDDDVVFDVSDTSRLRPVTAKQILTAEQVPIDEGLGIREAFTIGDDEIDQITLVAHLYTVDVERDFLVFHLDDGCSGTIKALVRVGKGRLTVRKNTYVRICGSIKRRAGTMVVMLDNYHSIQSASYYEVCHHILAVLAVSLKLARGEPPSRKTRTQDAASGRSDEVATPTEEGHHLIQGSQPLNGVQHNQRSTSGRMDALCDSQATSGLAAPLRNEERSSASARDHRGDATQHVASPAAPASTLSSLADLPVQSMAHLSVAGNGELMREATISTPGMQRQHAAPQTLASGSQAYSPSPSSPSCHSHDSCLPTNTELPSPHGGSQICNVCGAKFGTLPPDSSSVLLQRDILECIRVKEAARRSASSSRRETEDRAWRGISITYLCKRVQREFTKEEFEHAIDVLLEDGHIYETVDECHFGLTDLN